MDVFSINKKRLRKHNSHNFKYNFTNSGFRYPWDRISIVTQQISKVVLAYQANQEVWFDNFLSFQMEYDARSLHK